MISFDVLQFKRESDKEFEHLVKGYNDAVTQATRKGWQIVTQNTRVDTGRARASWEVGVGRRKYIRLPKTPRGRRIYPDPALRNFKFDVRRHTEIYISNILPYIDHLDKGTDRMPPGAMTAMAIPAVRSSLRNRFTRLR